MDTAPTLLKIHIIAENFHQALKTTTENQMDLIYIGFNFIRMWINANGWMYPIYLAFNPIYEEEKAPFLWNISIVIIWIKNMFNVRPFLSRLFSIHIMPTERTWLDINELLKRYNLFSVHVFVLYSVKKVLVSVSRN